MKHSEFEVDQTAAAYVANELSERQQEQFELHLISCTTCLGAVELWRATREQFAAPHPMHFSAVLSDTAEVRRPSTCTFARLAVRSNDLCRSLVSYHAWTIPTSRSKSSVSEVPRRGPRFRFAPSLGRELARQHRSAAPPNCLASSGRHESRHDADARTTDRMSQPMLGLSGQRSAPLIAASR